MKKIIRGIIAISLLLLLVGCQSGKKYTEEDFKLHYEIMNDFDGKNKIVGDIINKTKKQDYENVKIKFNGTTKDGRKIDLGTVTIEKVAVNYSSKFELIIDDVMTKEKLNIMDFDELDADLI